MNLLKKELNKDQKMNVLIFAFGIALYYIIFMWGFFDGRGFYSFGYNMTIMVVIFLSYYLYHKNIKNSLNAKSLWWLLPIILMGVSFSLYENPYLKIINLFVIPISLFLLFLPYGYLKKTTNRWGVRFILHLAGIGIKMMDSKLNSKILIQFLPFKTSESVMDIVKKIFLGILILIGMLIVIIPLLMSADSNFDNLIRNVGVVFESLFKLATFLKLIIFLIVFFLMVIFSINWMKEYENIKSKELTERDSVVGGILLGGIFFIYVLFLYMQMNTLWVDNLPIQFQETERLVKSGFWQLLFLTILNIVLLFNFYRRTNSFVQKILLGFTIASLLLVVSATYRVFFYVYLYGLSYEKFFAMYTVIFCIILFLWLLIVFFRKNRVDIFKYFLFQLVVMYSLLTIMPVERIIMNTNISLKENNLKSRINLYELQMLSSDIMPIVLSYKDSESGWNDRWHNWREKWTTVNKNKKWYEKNLSNF